jgi:uncharacterized protein
MSQPAKLQEPTMEEILASIRRIIAEDDLRPPPPPSPPPTPPAKPASAESAPIPTAVEPQPAPPVDMVEGFDDPEVSSVAANDVFEQRESPWRPGESVGGAVEEAREPAAAEVDLDAPKLAASLDALRFAAAPPEPAQPEPAPPEPARDLPSREPPRPPRFEPFRAEAAKAEFARGEAAKSDSHRPDIARPDLPKLDLPKFELPRRDAARWESARPESKESARPDLTRPESTRTDWTRPDWTRPDSLRPESSMRPEPARPPAAAVPPALRAADESVLLSSRTTAAVDLAFNTLAQTVLMQNSRTLEDLVREMLKPMLKAWLDDNLPGLVERLVRAEIERVSRGRS